MPKILCIRLSAMGDLIVTTPIYRVLHEQLGAEVHLVAKPVFAPVVAHNPHVARLIAYREGVGAELAREGYDLVVDLHGSIRSHLLRARLGVPTVGFRKRNLEKSLLPRGIDLLGGEHLLHRYFFALRYLGVRDDGRGLDYYVQPAEAAAAAGHTAPTGGDYVAVVLGATHYTKRMPPALVAEAIGRLDRPVVLLGGADVTALAAEVIARLPPGAPVLDLCDRLPLRESIAVLAEAAGVVAGDTGLMHVTAALRRPMVVVWGNTAPAIGMYPWYPAADRARWASAEVLGLDCRPCSRIGFAACPRGHFRCMREQRAAAIAEPLLGLMAMAPSADWSDARPTGPSDRP